MSKEIYLEANFGHERLTDNRESRSHFAQRRPKIAVAAVAKNFRAPYNTRHDRIAAMVGNDHRTKNPLPCDDVRRGMLVNTEKRAGQFSFKRNEKTGGRSGFQKGAKGGSARTSTLILATQNRSDAGTKKSLSATLSSQATIA